MTRCLARPRSYLRPEFLIGAVAFGGRSLKYIEPSMPPTPESGDQIVAWIAFAGGIDFRPRRTRSVVR